MNITREVAVAKLESWVAVNANVQLLVRDIHGQGFQQMITIPEVSLEFVKLDIGGGDWIRLALGERSLRVVLTPGGTTTVDDDAAGRAVRTRNHEGILNFVLYEVAE